ncbi:MAG: carboxypeptidase regulatory-like domain-containing protein, partial [Terriglobales bacterium]
MKVTASKLLLAALLCALCGSVILSTGSAFAQTVTSGDILGTVTDPQGAVVPNAAITAKNQETGASVSTKTTSQGTFRISSLPPGRYNLTATAGGFSHITRPVVVAIGGTTSANLQMGLSGNATTVEVTAETPVVTLSPSDTTTFDRIQVEQAPNGGQDLTSIAQTTPGAKMNTQGGYGNFEVNGLPGTSNNFTMNGGPENDPYLNLNNSGASNLLLGTNDVSEVTLVSNGYSGQYGHLAGAQYNATSISGTNQFHGNAKYWWSGSVLNARDYFNSGAGSTKPRENLNQWAARLNGPIVKDKTFFAVDYEGYRVVLPTSNQTYIPTVGYESAVLANLNANGMASSVPWYQNMFNLYNGAPGAGRAAPVAASEDPALGCGDIINPDGTSNVPGITAGTPCARKFTSTVGNFTPEWNLAARVDQHIGNNDSAFIHFRTDHGVQPTFTDPINPVFNAKSVQPDYECQLSETHVLGPNAVNQAILTVNWYSAIFESVNQAAATKAFPAYMTFGDGLFTDLGGENYVFPQGRNITQMGLNDDYSWTHGRHTIKFGGTYNRNYVTDAGFGVLTTPLAEPLSMTDFSSGIMDVLEQRFPTKAEQRFRLWNMGLYIQDDFQATNKLKLTLTLRAEHNGNPVCFNNCFARLTGPFASVPKGADVAYNSVIQSSLTNAFPSVPTVLWAPRLGFTFNPWTDTVLSGGFGIFYDAAPASVISRFNRNSPQVNQFVDQN